MHKGKDFITCGDHKEYNKEMKFDQHFQFEILKMLLSQES
jgi:hypothetical protein